VAKKKDQYHHGDLRSTLLAVATEMIAEEGAENLTMRGLSQRIGVSRTAPYRHFPDKAALLAAVAEEGFTRLTHHLQAEKAKDTEDVLLCFHNMCVAYIHFAVENPTHYRLMFGKKPFEWQNHPGLAVAASAAFGEVMKIIREAQQENKMKPGSPHDLAYVAWAMIHGWVSLCIDGLVRNTVNIEELTHLTVQMLLEGMKC
jgi:AcrR family transcriptional regulator